MYFEGDCKTAGTISMNDGGAHATCLHIKGGEKDGVKTSGMLYANLG
jgi:predicted DNA-binding protein with PD1-like motif